MRIRLWFLSLLLVAGAATAGYVYWRHVVAGREPDGIVAANGRIEAEQVYIAAKYAGRIREILVEEGAFVAAGAVIARMDTAQIEAQLRAAEAEARRTESARIEAKALIAQRQSERVFAQAEFNRAKALHDKGHASAEAVDQRRMQMAIADAGERAALAGLDQATAAVEAATANIAQYRTVLDDAVLTTPRSGRLQHQLAKPGEVVAAGGRVASVIDTGDVYMTVFLSARNVGKLAFGAEARIVLDPFPQYVVPAAVSFVSGEAQFTPKSVETAEEREDLMFRVKLRIAPALLKQYEERVKTGVRGVAHVRTKDDAPWPPSLSVRLP